MGGVVGVVVVFGDVVGSAESELVDGGFIVSDGRCFSEGEGHDVVHLLVDVVDAVVVSSVLADGCGARIELLVHGGCGQLVAEDVVG